MLEVGNLASAVEDRSHFAAWAVVSSPLILSFNLSDPRRMDRAWPIISNRALLGVNQRWAGSPGRRVGFQPQNGFQAWAKPMGNLTYAVFLLNGGEQAINALLPIRNVSEAWGHAGVCLQDLFTGLSLPTLEPGQDLGIEGLQPHDSGMFCAWPVVAGRKGHRPYCRPAAAAGCPLP